MLFFVLCQSNHPFAIDVVYYTIFLRPKQAKSPQAVKPVGIEKTGLNPNLRAVLKSEYDFVPLDHHAVDDLQPESFVKMLQRLVHLP